MNKFAIALSGAFLLAALFGSAVAQSPSGTDTQPAAPAPDASKDKSGETRSSDVKANTDVETDDGSASPRTTTTTETRVFGLSPTALILISAAILFVVVLAIVAMARTPSDTRIDIDRRP